MHLYFVRPMMMMMKLKPYSGLHSEGQDTLIGLSVVLKIFNGGTLPAMLTVKALGTGVMNQMMKLILPSSQN